MYINIYEILNDKQFGFNKHIHFAYMALIELVDKISTVVK